jgi:hypothetical protein
MIAKRYEEAFKDKQYPGFSKRRVADTVKKLLHETKDDQETQDNLGTLSTALITCLKSQIPTPAPPTQEANLAEPTITTPSQSTSK